MLLQQGKGADAGATFGGGGNTFFGSSGADNLLTRVTTFTAVAFMLTSITLAVHAKKGGVTEGELIKQLPQTAPVTNPIAEDVPAAKSAESPAAEPAGSGDTPVETTSEDAAAKVEATGDTAASSTAAPVAETAASETDAADAPAVAVEKTTPADAPTEATVPAEQETKSEEVRGSVDPYPTPWCWNW